MCMCACAFTASEAFGSWLEVRTFYWQVIVANKSERANCARSLSFSLFPLFHSIASAHCKVDNWRRENIPPLLAQRRQRRRAQIRCHSSFLSWVNQERRNRSRKSSREVEWEGENLGAKVKSSPVNFCMSQLSFCSERRREKNIFLALKLNWAEGKKWYSLWKARWPQNQLKWNSFLLLRERNKLAIAHNTQASAAKKIRRREQEEEERSTSKAIKWFQVGCCCYCC